MPGEFCDRHAAEIAVNPKYPVDRPGNGACAEAYVKLLRRRAEIGVNRVEIGWPGGLISRCLCKEIVMNRFPDACASRNPAPPGEARTGSATHAVKNAATAASNALPPQLRISLAAVAVSRCPAATTPTMRPLQFGWENSAPPMSKSIGLSSISSRSNTSVEPGGISPVGSSPYPSSGGTYSFMEPPSRTILRPS